MRYLPLGLVLCLAACGSGVPADAAAAKAEVQAVIEKWHENYDSGNFEAIEQMLDPEVSFPVPPDQFLHGREAVAARYKKDIEEYVIARDYQGKRKTRYGPIRITLSGNLAVVRYDVTITDPGGVNAALFTRVLRKDGQWLLLCEHYTVSPVTSKPNNGK